jgi:preprotein translocase subunit SecD
MVRRACATSILAIVAAACGGDPASPSEAAAFQLRPVVEIVSGSSPRPYVPVTCDAEGHEAAACLDAHAGGSVVVLEPTSMDLYELGPVVVDAADVADAEAVEDQAGAGWSVTVQLTPEATDAFASATRAAVGDRFAILVDGRVVSAPTVQAPIGSGNIVVTVGLPEAEAKELADRLGG